MSCIIGGAPLMRGVMTAHSGKHLGVRLAAFGAVCVVVSILVAAFWPPREPAYNGHSLSYWFQRLPVLSGQPNVGFAGIYEPPQGAALAECRTALKAIKAMGTNTLPYLNRRLQAPAPSWPIGLLYHHAGNWPVVGNVLARRDPLKQHGRALAGLLVLCPLPPDAERKVRDLSLDFKAPTWRLALVIVKAQNDPRIAEDNL